jgi:hypothetical protein
MHALALSFIGILLLSLSKRFQHELIGEVFIDYTVDAGTRVRKNILGHNGIENLWEV